VPQVRPRQDARAEVNLETIALRYNRGHNGRLLSGLIGSSRSRFWKRWSGNDDPVLLSYPSPPSLIPAPLSAGGDSGDCVPGEFDEFVEGRFRKTLDIAMGAIIHAVGIGHDGSDAIGLYSAGAKARHV
jgi:hypothetical protein